MKRIGYLILGSLFLITSSVFAENRSGQFFGITPTHAGITEDFCKVHALDSYVSEANSHEITAQNGVKAKDLGFTTKEAGGVYLITGKAQFSGEAYGKKWQQKVTYYGQSLSANGGYVQGVWYTADCKGFYKLEPIA